MGEAADAIRARVRRAGFDEREVHFIERVADWDAVRASSNNLSLFGSRKLIEMRLPSGKPGVGGANAIVDLLAERQPRQRLSHAHRQAGARAEQLRVGEGLRIRRRVACRCGRSKSRACRSGCARAPPTLELELDDDAVQFIVDRTEGNLLAAQQELEKLKLLAHGGKRVDLAAVQASIGDSARFDVFQLGEAALGADVPRALRILAGLRSEGVEPTLALWSLAREIHNVWGTTQNDGSSARGWQRPSAALENAKRRAAQAAVRAARRAHLARRSHDQGPAARRCLG